MDKFSLMQLAVETANFLRSKLYGSDREGIKSVIAAAFDVFTGVPFGATLSDEYRTNMRCLAAKEFDAQSFGLRIAA